MASWPGVALDEPKETDTPSPSLIAAFDATQQRHAEAVAGPVPLLVEMALTATAEVLPGATVLETEGEMGED